MYQELGTKGGTKQTRSLLLHIIYWWIIKEINNKIIMNCRRINKRNNYGAETRNGGGCNG